MKLSADYSSHEASYQQLKNTGASGWGGETYVSRMENWATTIASLLQNPKFPPAPAKILEIGSGAGDVSLQFSKLGYEVQGIEISETGVSWAQEKASDLNLSAKFFLGSAADLCQFQNEFFEIVIDGNCLHCIVGEDRMKCLREIYRVLSPGGLFFVSTMVGDPKQESTHFEFDTQSRYQIQSGVPYRYMGRPEQIVDELSRAGFEIFDQKLTQNSWWDHLTCLARKP